MVTCGPSLLAGNDRRVQPLASCSQLSLDRWWRCTLNKGSIVIGYSRLVHQVKVRRRCAQHGTQISQILRREKVAESVFVILYRHTEYINPVLVGFFFKSPKASCP